MPPPTRYDIWQSQVFWLMLHIPLGTWSGGSWLDGSFLRDERRTGWAGRKLDQGKWMGLECNIEDPSVFWNDSSFVQESLKSHLRDTLEWFESHSRVIQESFERHSRVVQCFFPILRSFQQMSIIHGCFPPSLCCVECPMVYVRSIEYTDTAHPRDCS